MKKRQDINDEKLVEASLSSVRISPSKLSALCRSVVNLPVNKAVMCLTFSKKAVAVIVNKLLKSAMVNAENNFGLDIDNLFVKRIDVGKAMVMKRFKARARGRGNRILKPFSKMRIVLVEKKGEE